jgi:hypothetical protein
MSDRSVDAKQDQTLPEQAQNATKQGSQPLKQGSEYGTKEFFNTLEPF